jgi:hypothetical protein
MIKHSILKLCSVMSVFCGSLYQETQANNTLVVSPARSNITIDGNLSDWHGVNATQPFTLHDKNSPSTQQTRTMVVFDEQNIYFAFDVKDKNIVGTNQPHDAKLFSTDDLIEVFIDPDGNGENYLEFGVNAFGNAYDYVVKCVRKNCGGWSDNKRFTLKNIEIKTSVIGSINNSKDIDTGFIVEIKLPFLALRDIAGGQFVKPTNNTIWRVNMFRIDYGNTPIEYQSWVPHNSFGFHQPDKFGYFHFTLSDDN